MPIVKIGPRTYFPAQFEDIAYSSPQTQKYRFSWNFRFSARRSPESAWKVPNPLLFEILSIRRVLCNLGLPPSGQFMASQARIPEKFKTPPKVKNPQKGQNRHFWGQIAPEWGSKLKIRSIATFLGVLGNFFSLSVFSCLFPLKSLLNLKIDHIWGSQS